MTEHVVKTGRSSAGPDAVWAVISDYFQLHTWASAIDHCSAMTATPIGPEASRRVVVGSAVLIENVVEWEPTEVMAYEIVGLPPVVSSVQNRWVLTPYGSGTTVELTASVTPGPRPPMAVAAKAVARRIGSTNQSLVDDAIARAEQELT
ncbi:MAG: SRPBCC family protein [Actinomycetota bacterium]